MEHHVASPCVESRRARLANFIAHQTNQSSFRLHDWLRTLETGELQQIEEDAQTCCFHDDASEAISTTVVMDLADAALMAYVAERRYEISSEEALTYLDDLLIGLSVAACIERLERSGWLISTDRVGILVAHPPPFRVTQKGLQEGIWSAEPMTLWLLGISLEIH